MAHHTYTMSKGFEPSFLPSGSLAPSEHSNGVGAKISTVVQLEPLDVPADESNRLLRIMRLSDKLNSSQVKMIQFRDQIFASDGFVLESREEVSDGGALSCEMERWREWKLQKEANRCFAEGGGLRKVGRLFVG